VRTFYGTAALEFRYARTWKGKLAQGFSYWMEKREARRCRITVGISPHVAAHLPGVDHVIPCMLDGAPDRAGTEKTAYPSLIFLGSRLSRKRGEGALEIFRGLRKTHPGLRLNYVGPQAEIDALRMRSGFEGVRFHARISQQELDDLYAESWIYLCLSSYEGFGVGIIEAMAHSCLVITSPHPGSEYLVRDGDTGLLAPLEGAQALVGRMLLDGDARMEITRRAREFSQRFHPAVVAASYADLYRMAHARASGTP
jgi:glycosyltransferase involved in cell wall biosynthesis